MKGQLSVAWFGICSETKPSRRSWPDGVHDLRHTAISFWIANGVDMLIVKKWAGHEKVTTIIDIYDHLYEDDDKAILGNLDNSIVSSSNGKPRRPSRTKEGEARRPAMTPVFGNGTLSAYLRFSVSARSPRRSCRWNGTTPARCLQPEPSASAALLVAFSANCRPFSASPPPEAISRR